VKHVITDGQVVLESKRRQNNTVSNREGQPEILQKLPFHPHHPPCRWLLLLRHLHPSGIHDDWFYIERSVRGTVRGYASPRGHRRCRISPLDGSWLAVHGILQNKDFPMRLAHYKNTRNIKIMTVTNNHFV